MPARINWPGRLNLVLLSSLLIAFPVFTQVDETNLIGWKQLREPLGYFSGRLFGAADRSKNVVMSPISVYQALLTLSLGVERHSETGIELARTLGNAGNSFKMEQLHEQYSMALELFEDVNEEAKKANQTQRRANLERHRRKHPRRPHRPARRQKNIGSNKDEYRPPIVDLMSFVVTNAGHSKLLPGYASSVSKYYKNSLAQAGKDDPKGTEELVERANKWAKEAGFQQEALKADELTSDDWKMMLMTGLHLEASWFSRFSEREAEVAFYNRGLKSSPAAGTVLSHPDLEDVGQLKFVPEYDIPFNPDNITYDWFAHDYIRFKYSYLNMIELPLQGGLSLVIIEQMDKTKNDIELMPELKHGEFLPLMLNIFDRLNFRYKRPVTLPKFKFENQIDLLKGIDLKVAGLERTFSKENEDIAKISEGPPLFVSKASHQAMIDVDKNGIKASALTKIYAQQKSMPVEEIQVQNPFIFIIRFHGLPIFVGQVLELPDTKQTLRRKG